ncbi:hypothetical protein ACFY4B_27030 [Kitasatospora sp. NPDC001261]|uniref:hypothetical protein n=1 Tax=Kitasatospora sp. NPDC001261 TaxID=3364012 RepID=UPI0036A4F521
MTTHSTPITRRRRGKKFGYERGCGLPWRTTLTFDPGSADMIHDLIEGVHPDLSASTVVNTIMSLVPATPNDPPLTRERIVKALAAVAANFGPSENQEALPMTG